MKIKFTLSMLFFCTLALAQNQKSEIKQVILNLFDGMREADTVKIQQCFYNRELTMYTSFANKKGEPMLLSDSVSDFIEVAGSPHQEIWDERLGAYTIEIDGSIASMNVEYYFFVDDTFSHCGVDFFHLFNSKDGWKIISLADTRRQENCDIPEETW